MSKESDAERRAQIHREFEKSLTREEITEIQIWKQRSEELKKNFRPPCDECGKPSQFIKHEGSYTRVWGVYQCPNGHQFIRG